MMRMLIVDDEVSIANAVYHYFLNQADLPLELYRVYSAPEALKLFDAAKIDLLLTDISMPGMDGIALLERVKANWPACRVIFLTAYENFEYAYSALRYEGVSYLLKSEGYDALNARVRGQIDALEVERRQRIERARLASASAVSLSALLEARSGRYAFLIVRAEVNAGACASVIPALMPFAPALSACDGGLYVALIDLDAMSNAKVRLSETLEELQRDAAEALGARVALALSDAVEEGAQLTARYDQLRARLLRAIARDPGALVQDSDAASTQRGGFDEETEPLGTAGIAQARALERALELRDWQEALDALQDISLRGEDPLLLSELICRVNAALLRAAREMGVQPEALRGSALAPMTAPLQGTRQWPALWKRWLEALREAEQTGMDPVVERTIRIIRENLGQDLSLVYLSGQAHYHPAYFSRLFKSETGETLSDYITRLRIETAKELLNRHKVSEVSRLVGFTSPRYFSRVFKERTGVAPQDWKAQDHS